MGIGYRERLAVPGGVGDCGRRDTSYCPFWEEWQKGGGEGESPPREDTAVSRRPFTWERLSGRGGSP